VFTILFTIARIIRGNGALQFLPNNYVVNDHFSGPRKAIVRVRVSVCVSGLFNCVTSEMARRFILNF